MFVAAVLAFVLGIYLQAFHPVAVLPLSVLLCGSVVLAPFLSRRYKGAAIFLVLSGFCLAGCLRLALLHLDNTTLPVEETPGLYAGTVVESSAAIKTVRLSYPESCKGLRSVLVSDIPMPLNTEVQVMGRLRDLNPSFKNPSVGSWKWLKRLEGIGYEVKGSIVAIRPGTSIVEAARHYFKRTIEESGAKHRDVLATLTIGDRTALDREKNNLFVRTGTSHVLAISGFNVGIISGFFFFLIRLLFGLKASFRLSGRHTRYAALLTLPFPFMFMFIAGAGVSVIRATLMILVCMLSVFFERNRHAINITALSALVILLIYPHSLFAPSFQLTFMSLVSIMIFLDNWYFSIARIKWFAPRWIVSAVSSTAAATLGTAPVVIYHFYGINPLTALHNLVAVPLIGVAATSLSLVGMLHNLLAPVLWAAGWVIELNIRILKAMDAGYIWPIVRPNLLEIIMYYLLLFPLFCIRKKPAAAVLLVSLPLFVGTLLSTLSDRFSNDLRVNFLDMGGGDCILVEGPGGLRMLVDGGGFSGGGFDVGEKVLTPFLLSKKIRTLDYVIATHPHMDHAGGLYAILRNFRVSHVVTGNFFPDYPEFQRLLEYAGRSGSVVDIWKRGDSFRLGSGLHARVLNPPASRRLGDVNDSSLVLLLRHGVHRFLLAGDIRQETEEELILSGPPLGADVLKVAHHGSRFSSTIRSLLAIRPGLAVITCGPGTSKGLPSPETLQRFEALRIPVLRTDRQGMVQVQSEGKRLTYTTFEGTAGRVYHQGLFP